MASDKMTPARRDTPGPEYLAAIVESSDDAIIAKHLDGEIQWCNAGAERMFGYPADELVGRSINLLIPPDRQEEEGDILARLRAGQRVDHFETVRIRKDGRRIDVSVSISPVRDASGRIIGASKIARDITEQKRATAAHAYLASIVEWSNDVVIAKDLDGVITSSNATAERVFGYSPGELVGQSIRVLIPPERQAEEDEILTRLRRGERLDHFETVRVAKDGRRLDVSLTVSPIRDSTGAIVGASKIVRDITEQKRTAAALSAQREWFRVTLASIGDAVIASDHMGVVTYLNAPAEALTGWTTGEAAGRPLAEVFHIVNEKTRQPVENPADIVMRHGHIVGLANHTVLISRDGTEQPIADSAAPIRDGAGQILGVVLVFRDVTAERRAEEAIVEQREWFETTLESIGDAVIATDVRGQVVFMNPVAEHLTGWRVDDARGLSCVEVFKIVNEQTRRAVENPVTHVLSEGTIVGLANHTVLIAADGTERPIDDSGAPIRNRDGRIVGVILVFRDVSDRRRGEFERRSAATERERLLEAERAARADAERANRVKDDFVAVVSHELRTPLNAILGWTQLMMKSRGDASLVDRGLDVVARNTRVQAQLVSDLLDISRIVSGKLRLDIDNVDLATTIGDAVEMVLQDASAKGVAIESQLAPGMAAVAGDPGRLQQVVWNLLSNAIKFTPAGGRVRIVLRQHDADAEVTISDTGAGIRPEFLPYVFERFQQADQTITRRFGGLGLGLSIAKHLMELHGGAIKADSPGEGKGATFTITLPSTVGRISAERSVPFEERRAPEKELTDAISLSGVRVLLVEDDADTREFLTRLLTDHGAHVLWAPSAPEALALLAAHSVDVLVSDIGLPEMDGYDLMQQVRGLGANNGGGIPAIALTAYARAEDRRRALMAGYQAHVVKPVESVELVAMVARFSELVRSHRTALPDSGHQTG